MRADLSILRDRSFLLLFSARSVSLLGDAIAPVALAFAVLGMPDGSGSTLGIVAAARIAAQVAFLLYGGVLADRLPRHRVMVGADLTAGLAQGAVAVLVLTGTDSLAGLVVLSMVSGAASALFTPASRSVTVQLVPAEKIQSANALVQLSMNAGSIGGAALAGVLVVLLGAGWALVVDAATFLVSAVLLAGVRLTGTADQPSPTEEGIFFQLRHGWREFTERTWLWAAVAQLALVNVCIGAGFIVLGPVEAEAHLGGASGWAAVLTAQAVGFVAGSLLAIRLRPRRPLRAAVLFTLGIVPSLVALACAAPVAVTAGAMFVTGLCMSLNDVTFLTALQKHVPEESMSRVMSYDAFGSFVFLPLGLAVAAPIADRAGSGAVFLGAACLVAAAAGVVLAVPGVRTLPSEPQPAAGAEAGADRPQQASAAVPASVRTTKEDQ
ncbi:MFS transporter [Kitasatospora sp. SC0581]|uniref:MFS transporter n=1 Tax=Kitasatospora sp. SC0581 TaxID=3394360 RepID=UPI003A8AC845